VNLFALYLDNSTEIDANLMYVVEEQVTSIYSITASMLFFFCQCDFLGTTFSFYHHKPMLARRPQFTMEDHPSICKSSGVERECHSLEHNLHLNH
jgi:hypothetical protein